MQDTNEAQAQTWYYVERHKHEPTSRPVYAETDLFVTTHRYGRRVREKKETEWGRWFRTEDEALAHLRARLDASVANLRNSLATAEARLADFNAKYPLEAPDAD